MSRFAMVAVVGSLTAACSTEALRFSETPFANPFKTADAAPDPVRTGSIDEPSDAPRMPRSTVRSEPLEPVRTASLPAPQQPAPMPRTSAAPMPRTAVAGAPGWSAAGGTDVTVGSGDTLAGIANRYGVPPSAILSANGLTASQVVAGRRIVIPVYSTTAESGASARPARTVEAAPPAGRIVASSRIDVKKPVPSTVAEAAPPKTRTRPGQPVVAKAPEPVRTAPKVVAEAKPAARPPVKVAAAPPTPAPKVTSKPETKPAKVAKAEPAPAPKVAKAEPVAAPKVEPAKPKVVAKAPEPVKPVATPAPAKVAAAEPPKVVPKEPESTGAIPAAPASATPEFRWPARGRVITGFGGGGSSEGINIAVPDGTPVKAAGDGVVAYAGSEVKGYGNLVLIRHDNGYVSAYAHNGDLDVKRGQKVTRGQTIAKSGQTGNVTSPQLHFEIRKGSTPVDPMRYLASAN